MLARRTDRRRLPQEPVGSLRCEGHRPRREGDNDRKHRAFDARFLFGLSREEQLTHKEIANYLNISIKTVENQLTIALRRVRHHLKEYSIMCLLSFLLFTLT